MNGDHDHSHEHGAELGNERRMTAALLLTGGFMLVEVVGGILSGSLALLADAGHMLTDTAALGLSLAALRASRKPASPSYSYGFHRFQMLAAFVNGAALIGICAWIAIEAVSRLLRPVEILAGPMMAVAVAGLAVNILCFAILHSGEKNNLNMQGAALHVLGDLLGSMAAILAAGGILLTGWTPLDPILSLLVAALILKSAWGIISRSGHVLMEGSPEGIDIDQLRTGLVEAVPGVIDIHHVHLWMLTPDQPMLTLHATIDRECDEQEALHAIQKLLGEGYGLWHATIQIERTACCMPHDGDACAYSVLQE